MSVLFSTKKELTSIIILKKFDSVFARIETCRGKELHHSKVLATWEKNPSDEDLCTASDALTFCPSYKRETLPILPGIRSFS